MRYTVNTNAHTILEAHKHTTPEGWVFMLKYCQFKELTLVYIEFPYHKTLDNKCQLMFFFLLDSFLKSSALF